MNKLVFYKQEAALDSIMDMRAFDKKFQTALIFSIFEGLLSNRRIRMILDQNPHEILQQFKNAQIQNISWDAKQIAPEVWDIEMSKLEKHNSCCGICGTHGG